MKFTKLHGCGNGYIYVNLFEETLENPAEMSIKVPRPFPHWEAVPR